MTKVNITVDDTSPLLTYSDNWTAQGYDLYSSNYQGFGASTGTRHGTYTYGASVSLNYVGSSLWAYGSKRNDHGMYQVQLDDGNQDQYSGWVAGEQYQVLLNMGTDQTSIEQGNHTIALTDITNAPDREWFDLDWVTFETEIGSEGADLTNSTVDLTSATIEWNPPLTQWSFAGNDTNSRSTTQKGAGATLSFSGDAVYVLGGVSGSTAPTVASVNETQSYSLAAPSSSLYVPDSLLFFATGLPYGTHRLSILHAGNASQTLEIGSFVVVKAEVNIESNSTTASSHQTSRLKSTGLSGGARAGIIAGGVVAGAILLALLIVCVPRWTRRRRLTPGSWDDPTHPILGIGHRVEPMKPIHPPHVRQFSASAPFLMDPFARTPELRHTPSPSGSYTPYCDDSPGTPSQSTPYIYAHPKLRREPIIDYLASVASSSSNLQRPSPPAWPSASRERDLDVGLALPLLPPDYHQATAHAAPGYVGHSRGPGPQAMGTSFTSLGHTADTAYYGNSDTELPWPRGH